MRKYSASNPCAEYINHTSADVSRRRDRRQLSPFATVARRTGRSSTSARRRRQHHTDRARSTDPRGEKCRRDGLGRPGSLWQQHRTTGDAGAPGCVRDPPACPAQAQLRRDGAGISTTRSLSAGCTGSAFAPTRSTVKCGARGGEGPAREKVMLVSSSA